MKFKENTVKWKDCLPNDFILVFDHPYLVIAKHLTSITMMGKYTNKQTLINFEIFIEDEVIPFKVVRQIKDT